jgi:hypothetical protein
MMLGCQYMDPPRKRLTKGIKIHWLQRIDDLTLLPQVRNMNPRSTGQINEITQKRTEKRPPGQFIPPRITRKDMEKVELIKVFGKS